MANSVKPTGSLATFPDIAIFARQFSLVLTFFGEVLILKEKT